MPPRAAAYKRKRKSVDNNELQALDRCFPRDSRGRRSCAYCDDCDYSASTSNDNLRYHMHEKHEDTALELGIRPSSQHAVILAPSSSSLSAPVDLIDEPDGPSSLPVVPSSISLSSASSVPFSSSSFSSASSFSSSSSASLRPGAAALSEHHHGHLPSSFSSSSSAPFLTAALSSSSSSNHRPFSDSSSISSRRKQNRIDQYGVFASVSSLRQTDAVSKDMQVDLWLYESLAYRLADSPYLRRWLSVFRQSSGEVLGRKQISLRAPARAEVVMNSVKHLLRQSSGVTVGIDGWTNIRQEKVVNFCPVGQNIAFYYHSAVLKQFSTAAAQHIPVRDGLRAIMDAGICVMAIVTDNEPVNLALYRDFLANDFPFLVHVPCAAHTVQLCVRSAMGLPAVVTVVQSLLALLHAFKSSKALRINVKAQQALLRQGEVALQIINIVDTRWNSVLYAGKRILLLQKCIEPFIPLVISTLAKNAKFCQFTFSDVDFWYPLNSFLDFLVPYQIATDVLQSDASSLGDVHSQFVTLIQAADSLVFPHPLAGMREELMATIRHQWNDHVNHDVIITCCFLSHDDRYSQFGAMEKHTASDWFTGWGVKFLSHYRLSDSDNVTDISALLFQQLSHFTARVGVFSSFNTYQGLDSLPHAAHGAAQRIRRDLLLSIWRKYLNGAATELAYCALALLSITASEAAVERSFSRQGIIHSDLRNRTSEESVYSQMCVAFNSRALERAALSPEQRLDRGVTEELPDEDVSDGTALLSQQYRDNLVAAVSEPNLSEADAAAAVNFDQKADEEAAVQLEEEEQLGRRHEGKDADEPVRTIVMSDQQFIDWYLAANHVTLGYRWTSVREGQLLGALVEKNVRTQARAMIEKIKAHLAVAAAVPDAQ